MAKRNRFTKPLTVAISVAVTLTAGISAAMARGGGGGHCGGGGGHCGGSHFSSGAHFSGGSHFSHFSSGSHFSSSHISASHISSSHASKSCDSLGNSSGKHGFSLFGGHARSVTPEQSMGFRALEASNSNLHLQEIAEHNGGPSPYCSSIIRSEPHAGLFGHIHRMFGGSPCELQNIHTEIMPQVFTEIACAPTPCVTHQNFSRENLALNQIAAQSSYLRANAVKIRCLNQLNRNFYATQLPDNYFSVNVDNTAYPATDLDTVMQNDYPSNVDVDVVAENEAPTFSGLSYMLPNTSGILNIYFSYESTINNFLQLHKASFLAAAMHQLL